MSQAFYSKDYLSDKVKREIYTPTKLRNGEVNSSQYSIGWRVGDIKLNDESDQS